MTIPEVVATPPADPRWFNADRTNQERLTAQLSETIEELGRSRVAVISLASENAKLRRQVDALQAAINHRDGVIAQAARAGSLSLDMPQIPPRLTWMQFLAKKIAP